MIFWLILTVSLGWAVIILAHILGRNKTISAESARKSVHIAHALVIGSWPFFANYKAVIIGEIVSLFLVLAARKLGLFKHFREVERLSWGEFFFPVAVIIMAVFEPSEWLFLAAVLHFGLADALAAIIGNRAKSQTYVIFGHKKSLVGTAVFWLTSFIICSWYIFGHTAPETMLLPLALVVPTVTAAAENLSPWGSDNMTVPLLAFWLLGGL